MIWFKCDRYVWVALLVVLIGMPISISAQLIDYDAEDKEALEEVQFFGQNSKETGYTSFSTTAAGSASSVQTFLPQPDSLFGLEEINFHHGTFQVSRQDVSLPGKNGLSFQYGRIYQSNQYRSETGLAQTGTGFSGEFGKGWASTAVSRAYLIQKRPQRHWGYVPGGVFQQKTLPNRSVFERDHSAADRNNVDFEDFADSYVVIQTATGAQTYRYHESTGKYHSENPNNGIVCEADTETGEITQIHPGGLKQIYALEFFQEYQEMFEDGHPRLYPFNVRGSLLTRTEDIYGNRIQYNYDYIDDGPLRQRGHRHHNHILSRALEVDTIAMTIWSRSGDYHGELRSARFDGVGSHTLSKRYRLNTVVDTFDRNIQFNYENDNFPDNVTKITYTGVNGNPYEVGYNYGSAGQLESVDQNGLAEESYTYGWYDYDLPGDSGYILRTVKSPLGSEIEYSIERCWMGEHNPVSDYRNVIRSISFPVVTRKIIRSAEGSEKVYAFHYERRHTGSHNMIRKRRYEVAWKSGNNNPGYGFRIVHLETPSEEADIYYTYENGNLVTETNGTVRKVTAWNDEKDHVEAVKVYRNEQLISQKAMTYSSYDYPVKAGQVKSSDHPKYTLTTTVKNYDGDTLYTTKETTYKREASLINKNLVGLVDTETVTDKSGQKKSVKFTYTANGKRWESWKKWSGSSLIADASDWIKDNSITYDNVGRIKAETTYGGPSPQTKTFDYTISGSDYKIQTTYNGKQTEETHHLTTGQKREIKDLNGNITTYSYDNHGRLIAEIPSNKSRTTYSYPNLKETRVAFEGLTTITQKDSLGRTIKIDRPNGQDDTTIQYHYNQLKSQETTGPHTITYDEYDNQLRLLQKTSNYWGTTKYSYDDDALTESVTDPADRTTTIYKNRLGQVTKTVYEPDNTETQYYYDGFGNKTHTIDSRGNVRKAHYDPFSRLLKADHTTKSTNPARKRQILATYDDGTLKETRLYADTQANDLVETTTYAYDSENRITALKKDSQIVETYTYEEPGRRNATGQLTKLANDTVTTVYDYDKYGRPEQQTHTVRYPGDITQTYSLTHGYHARLGTMDNLELRLGDTTPYKLETRYDNQHRPQYLIYNGQTLVTYVYNPNGTLKEMRYKNGTTLHHTYEKGSQLKTLVAKRTGSKDISHTYTYDNLGRMTQDKHTAVDDENDLRDRNYAYNTRDELTSIGAYNKDNYYEFAYDTNLNLTTLKTPKDPEGTQNNFHINAHNDQLVKRTYRNATQTIDYDAKGNMKTRALRGKVNRTHVYAYTYNNQLASIQENGKLLASYGYNPARERLYKQVGNQTTAFYWDTSGRIIAEGEPGKTPAIRYIYSGNQKVAMETENPRTGKTELFYFLNNAQGTPTHIQDKDGKIVQWIQLDEYGNLEQSYGVFPEEQNYTGKKLDPESGLYYFNQRYYDPMISRFLSEDPAAQTLNPYVYSGNSPAMYVDPDGQFFFLATMGKLGGWWTAAAAVMDTLAVSWAANDYDSSKMTWESFGKAAGRQILSAGLSYGIGELGKALNLGDNVAFKTVAHSISGGVQSAVFNENFNIGFAAGGLGNIAGELGGNHILRRAALAGVAAGLTSEMFGGEFMGGFVAGSGNQIYNWGLHEALHFLDDVSNAMIIGGLAVPFDGPMIELLGLGLKGGVKGVRSVSRSLKHSEGYLGKGSRVVTNSKGDKVFISKDGLRKIRFDINNSHRGSTGPHMHIEKKMNGRWVDAISGKHRIYPR